MSFDFADEISRAGKHLFSGQSQQMFVGYEANGPGEDFHRDLLRNGYHAIYKRRTTTRLVDRRGKDFGWRSDPRTKRQLLTNLSRAMERDEIEIPSRPGLAEMLDYVFYPDGSIGPGHLQEELTGGQKRGGLSGQWAVRPCTGHP